MIRSDEGQVRVAIASAAALGESPFWHPTEQVLYYCDIPGHTLQRFDPATGALAHWDFDTDVASAAPLLGGQLLLAMRDGLWRFDPASGARRRVAEPPYDPSKERFNDGKCDPQGRFWVGTIYEPRDPALASLHRYARGRLERQCSGITVSNGLAWSPNGRTMYWSDTKAHTIYAFDFDPLLGELSRQRVFASFPPKVSGQPLSEYGVETKHLYNACYNISVAAWILRKQINEVGYNWQAVAHYHSRTPERGESYARKVARIYFALKRQQTERQEAALAQKLARR